MWYKKYFAQNIFFIIHYDLDPTGDVKKKPPASISDSPGPMDTKVGTLVPVSKGYRKM